VGLNSATALLPCRWRALLLWLVPACVGVVDTKALGAFPTCGNVEAFRHVSSLKRYSLTAAALLGLRFANRQLSSASICSGVSLTPSRSALKGEFVILPLLARPLLSRFDAAKLVPDDAAGKPLLCRCQHPETEGSARTAPYISQLPAARSYAQVALR
jgi:hypothetical protein